MQNRSERAERLLVAVETSPGSGDFRVDERLRAEEVWQRSESAVSTARIAVRLDDDFDSEEARRRYHPDCRLIVSTAESDPERREILFEGYPPVQSARWDGRIGHEEESYLFEAEHVAECLARGVESLIYGRRVRNGQIEQGLAAGPAVCAGRSVLVTALSCVFNPDGIGNRATAPLTVSRPGGIDRQVHIFGTDGTGVKWTFATALRYLVWFYLPTEVQVFEGNVFSVTDDLTGASDALSVALRREPVSLVCEGVHLTEALALWSTAAGVHITTETVGVAGRPVTRLRVWAAENGAMKQLYLVRSGRHADGVPRYNASTRTVAQVLTDNNTYRGEASWDHRPIVNCPVVIGDVKQYEMTVPLWPGWLPRAGLDNVAVANRQAARDEALTPKQVKNLGSEAESNAWYRRYHRDGSEFKNNADVARRWVLNEDGAFDGDLYNRNAPFDHYRPFDFSSVADGTVTRQGAWMRRPRLLRPTITAASDGRSLGVYVEVSFDSGGNWRKPSVAIDVLKDRAGIYFDCANPTEIVPAGVEPEVMNLWYAIINQTFRVRATAVIEGDERLMATFPADQLSSPTLQLNAVAIPQPKLFRYVVRSHTTDVLNVAGSTAGERDDSEAIAASAELYARTNQDRKVRVAPVIPWIETGYVLGDQITEMRGRQLRFATARGTGTRYPTVLERRITLRDGRYETVLTLG